MYVKFILVPPFPPLGRPSLAGGSGPDEEVVDVSPPVYMKINVSR